VKDLHVKKPGGWFWTPLSKDELETRIGAGLIHRDWRLWRDGENDVTTVGEYLKRTEQPSTGSQSVEPALSANLEGIGGWLVLVGLGLALAPIQLGGALITSYLPIFTGQAWSALTTPGTAAYHWMWKPLLLIELFGSVFLLIWAVALLFLFFGRKRIFPSLVIAFYAANLLLVLLDFVAVSAIPAVAAELDARSVLQLVKSILFCGIWIPYFLISERVKKTFTQ
jgi:hypothetical protein